MQGKFLLIMLIAICFVNSKLRKGHLRQDFAVLENFTCAVAKDVLEKHPYMRTIVVVELKNNFPLDFTRKVLKCLPKDVAKFMMMPHVFKKLKKTLILPKESMIIFIADKVELVRKNFYVVIIFLNCIQRAHF